MSIGRSHRWRWSLGLLIGFIVWNIAAVYALPIYAQAVVPTAQWVLDNLRLHNTHITFTDVYPYIEWQVNGLSQENHSEQTSFRLLSYNLVLYLTVLTAIPRLLFNHRIVLLLSGLPLIFVFHILDLILVVESKLLTLLGLQHYDYFSLFNLWFVIVKFSHNISVLALKQIAPVLLLLCQWYGLKRFLFDRK
jgi:hypothetical protein